MMNCYKTDFSSIPAWINYASGTIIASSLILNAIVFEMGGIKMIYYFKHRLSPRAGVHIQQPTSVPDHLTVLLSGQSHFVDWVVRS